MKRDSKRRLRELHGVMIDLFAFLNQPQRDVALLREAGISLDRALFPLLVAIERFGPIAVGELGNRVGRDYTTVSRQVAKLVKLRLVNQRPSRVDRRVNEANITKKGRLMTEALHAARLRLAAPILASWGEKDLRDLVRLMRRFVDDLVQLPETASRDL